MIKIYRGPKKRYIGEERKGKDAAYISALAFGTVAVY